MQVNYRPVSQTSFLTLALLALFQIGVPIWFFVYLGTPTGPGAGKIMVAPLGGVFCLGLLVIALRRNRALETDPLAFRWDNAGLTIHGGTRAGSFSWPEVGPVAVVKSKSGISKAAISMKVRDPRIGIREFTFDRNRLNLGERQLPEIVDAIERARRGEPLPPVSFGRSGARAESRVTGAGDGASEDRIERSREKGRMIGVLILFGYLLAVLTLLMSERAAPTRMLTSDGGLTWKLSVAAGMIAFWALFLPQLVSCLRRGDEVQSASASFSAISVVSLLLGAIVSLGAYPFAGAIAEQYIFSAPGVQRETRLFPIREAFVSDKGGSFRVRIPSDGPGIANLFGEAFFDLGPSDWAIFAENDEGDGRGSRTYRSYRGGGYCLALPVEVKGGAIRALVGSGTLPNGSVRPCA